MGEIRFVGTGETRRYPYPVCKKEVSNDHNHVDIHCGIVFIASVRKYRELLLSLLTWA